MRKLASIVEIESCEPIANADRLSVATMKGKGWKVVTGRDEFKPGNMCVYFEIDSYLPSDDERFAFLRERCLRKFVSKSGQVLKEGLRIKTCKLRGVLSQGLLMPIDHFPEITDRIMWNEAKQADEFDANEDGVLTDLVGADVTSLLHVEHYDEIVEALRPATGGGNPVCADAMGKFPSDYIPKTDEERIQNLSDYFTTMTDRSFEVTEKADGSSVTVFLSKTIDEESPLGVCSRNLRLKPEGQKGMPLPWKMVAKYDLETKLEMANAMMECQLAFQGELVGPGVNGNRDMLTDWEWRVFKIWDVSNQRYILPSVAADLCKRLDIPYVKVVERSKKVLQDFGTMEELLKYAEGKTDRGNEREGLVFKTVDYPFRSFKAVSNKYLLKCE